jgi:hypothetical protein
VDITDEMDVKAKEHLIGALQPPQQREWLNHHRTHPSQE